MDLFDGSGPSNFTLISDTFENDEVTGHLGEGGGASIATTGTVTLEDSTFVDDRASGSGGFGGGLVLFAPSATLIGDTFSGDTATNEGSGGGLWAQFTGPGVMVADSLFSDDSATDQGGGAFLESEAHTAPAATLSGNSFSHDAVADPAGIGAGSYSGGGLALVSFDPSAFVQSDNVFDSNSVSFKPTAAMATGGGESVTGAELESTGDHFTDNTLQSPDGPTNTESEPVFGWGAGLSVIACADLETLPPMGPNLISTVTDGVIAGNTLISGPSANGAGIYVGILECFTSYSDLQLDDSTVSGNVVSGASGPVAGISGGPHDVLSLANTIVSGDGGGPELGGFAGLANVTASYSDLCSGTSPFVGAGNICAEPKLVGPGPGGADVHETSTSPTLGAGSNALVPSGLATDAFGDPRILGPTLCGATQPAPTVDIGAAEFVYAPERCPTINTGPATHAAIAAILGSLRESARKWREGGGSRTSAGAKERATESYPSGRPSRSPSTCPRR